MKRHGILNSNISRVLSSMGHTDRIAIADCGLPVPEGTERIDLAVTFGNPRFMDVPENKLRLLLELRERYNTMLLSNTNELHWKLTRLLLALF